MAISVQSLTPHLTNSQLLPQQLWAASADGLDPTHRSTFFNFMTPPNLYSVTSGIYEDAMSPMCSSKLSHVYNQ